MQCPWTVADFVSVPGPEGASLSRRTNTSWCDEPFRAIWFSQSTRLCGHGTVAFHRDDPHGHSPTRGRDPRPSDAMP